MNRWVSTSCPFCGAQGTVRQICAEQYVWGGAPFGCSGCGGAFFQRHPSLAEQDDYWEGDTVNEEVYTVPEVRAAFARKYESVA